MGEKISDYYFHFTRAKFLLLGNTREHIKLANDELIKALEVKETKEAYLSLLENYAKLHDYMNIIKYCKALSGKYGGLPDTYLGILYTQNKEQEDFLKGIQCYEEAIKNFNNATAYLNLGKMYRDGVGVERDLDKAASIFEQALKVKDIEKRGEIESCLAGIYFEKQNYEKSFNLFKLAVEHGFLQANTNLALFYKDGLFVEKDLDAYMDHLLAWSSEDALMELGKIFIDNKLTSSDLYIFESCMYYAAHQYNNDNAYIILAAVEAGKENPRKDLITKYLTKAFAGKTASQDYESVLLSIENTFGEEYSDLIQSLVKKYWNIERHTA